jgi:hypothetical protein
MLVANASGESLSQRERVPPIARWAPGEGYKMKNIEGILMVPLTRPAGAGHPLPSGEGFARNSRFVVTGWASSYRLAKLANRIRFRRIEQTVRPNPCVPLP